MQHNLLRRHSNKGLIINYMQFLILIENFLYFFYLIFHYFYLYIILLLLIFIINIATLLQILKIIAKEAYLCFIINSSIDLVIKLDVKPYYFIIGHLLLIILAHYCCHFSL